MEQPVFIYILELKEGKYYIGKTKNPDFRLNSHFNYSGSAWTTKYKPIRVEKLIPNCSKYDEDKYTIQYMDLYGIENVRGGYYCQVALPDEIVSHLRQVINAANDRCYRCGKDGHFARECTLVQPKGILQSIRDSIAVPIKNALSYVESFFKKKTIPPVALDSSFTTKDSRSNDHSDDHSNNHFADRCSRCGRNSHSVQNCYAKTHLNGSNLQSPFKRLLV